MNYLFDPLNIILISITILILWKLSNVLGEKSGVEKPTKEAVQKSQVSEVPKIKKIHPEVVEQLNKLIEKDVNFNPEEFLQGARNAYETIITAYQYKDINKLRYLTTDKVFRDLDKQLKNSSEDGPRHRGKLDQVTSMVFNEIKIRRNLVTITMHIEASYIFEANKDSPKFQKIEELWKFQKDINSEDPNWQLSQISTIDK